MGATTAAEVNGIVPETTLVEARTEAMVNGMTMSDMSEDEDGVIPEDSLSQISQANTVAQAKRCAKCIEAGLKYLEKAYSKCATTSHCWKAHVSLAIERLVKESNKEAALEEKLNAVEKKKIEKLKHDFSKNLRGLKTDFDNCAKSKKCADHDFKDRIRQMMLQQNPLRVMHEQTLDAELSQLPTEDDDVGDESMIETVAGMEAPSWGYTCMKW